MNGVRGKKAVEINFGKMQDQDGIPVGGRNLGMTSGAADWNDHIGGTNDQPRMR